MLPNAVSLTVTSLRRLRRRLLVCALVLVTLAPCAEARENKQAV